MAERYRVIDIKDGHVYKVTENYRAARRKCRSLGYWECPDQEYHAPVAKVEMYFNGFWALLYLPKFKNEHMEQMS